jgi:HK97 family phage portal protein
LSLFDILAETRATLFAGTPISNPQQWLINMFGGAASKTGIQVTEDTAIKIAAVFACVNTISSDLSALPLNLKKSVARGSETATDHPVHEKIHIMPNPETTAFEFWQMFWVNYLLTNVGYAVIKRNGAGEITEVWNVPTKLVEEHYNQQTKESYYIITDDLTGQRFKYYQEEIFRLRGIRFQSNHKVLKFIEVAREALGLAVATEEFGARYFSNGAHMGGIVEYPGKLDDNEFKRFKDSFYEKYSSVMNSNKVLFLENGSKYTAISNNPVEAQAIEARKFQVIEIARYFNMPLYRIFDYDRSTFTNNEQQKIDYVTSCLNAHMVHCEQGIYKDWLLPKERRKYFAKYNVKGFLRGDTAAQQAFYQAMIQNGVYSPNRVLELEDENGYEGGDTHYVNGNMMPVEMVGDIWKSKIAKGGDLSANTTTGN